MKVTGRRPHSIRTVLETGVINIDGEGIDGFVVTGFGGSLEDNMFWRDFERTDWEIFGRMKFCKT